jgi:hypothetical protein
MTEVAVQKAGHKKHANKVQSDCCDYGHRTPPCPNNTEAPEVQKKKRSKIPEIKFVRPLQTLLNTFREIIGVENFAYATQEMDDRENRSSHLDWKSIMIYELAG